MKHFLIQYRREQGTPDEWHREIARFISALDSDPELAGRITYRCMKAGTDSSYLHIASPADDEATKILQGRDYFKHYTEATRRIAGGKVEVSPLEIVAETKRPA